MAGRTGGQSGEYWYNQMQDIPYQSRFREDQAVESQIKGQARSLDRQTTQLLNRLKLSEIERGYEEKETRLMEKEMGREASRVGGQEGFSAGIAAKQAAKSLVKHVPKTALGEGLRMGGLSAFAAATPGLNVLMAMNLLKAFGAENKLVDVFGGRAKNILSPGKWDIMPWNWGK